MIVRLILRYNLGFKKEGSGVDDAEDMFTHANGERHHGRQTLAG